MFSLLCKSKHLLFLFLCIFLRKLSDGFVISALPVQINGACKSIGLSFRSLGGFYILSADAYCSIRRNNGINGYIFSWVGTAYLYYSVSAFSISKNFNLKLSA